MAWSAHLPWRRIVLGKLSARWRSYNTSSKTLAVRLCPAWPSKNVHVGQCVHVKSQRLLQDLHTCPAHSALGICSSSRPITVQAFHGRTTVVATTMLWILKHSTHQNRNVYSAIILLINSRRYTFENTYFRIQFQFLCERHLKMIRCIHFLLCMPLYKTMASAYQTCLLRNA